MEFENTPTVGESTIQTNAIDEYLQALREKIDYEVRAAWRLGYKYAHVYEKRHVPNHESQPPTFDIDVIITKSDHDWYKDESPTPPDGFEYKHTYVLTDVNVLPAKERVQ